MRIKIDENQLLSRLIALEQRSFSHGKIRFATIIINLALIFLIFSATGCNQVEDVRVAIVKNGKPIKNKAVQYEEANNQMESQTYTGVTNADGEVQFQVESDGSATLFYLKVDGENNDEAIASGGFSGNRRIAKWNAEGYSVVFE